MSVCYLRKLCITITISLVFPLSIAANNARLREKVIVVNSQQDFSSIPSLIANASKEGYKKIRVSVQQGKYYFDEGLFTFKNFNVPDLEVSIEGRNSVIYPLGKTYRNGDLFEREISPNIVLVADDDSAIDLYSEMRQTSEIIEVVDEKSGLCRMKAAEEINGGTDGMYITIPQWYRAYTYKVTDYSDGYIFFVCNNLSKDKWNRYSINYDYTLHKDLPRYRLFNESGAVTVKSKRIWIDSEFKSVYSCEKCAFLRVWNSRFKSFSIEGFSFVGNCYTGSINCLLDFNGSDADAFVVKNCSFKAIKSQLMKIVNTGNVSFVGNTVEGCYGFGISSSNGSPNTVVTNNVFHDNGKDLQQDFSVSCGGADYYIANNTFYNFPYSAIRVGLHYQQEHKQKCNGIIERNELYYTKVFYENYWKHTLMDGGAIYVGTVNDGAIIRNNYIHDYIGMEGNRGIFCDDGAGNVEITGNVVVGTYNYYAIDSRRVVTMDKNYSDANRNVVIRNNVVEGKYLIEGRNNSCRVEANCVVNPVDSCKISGVRVVKNDFNLGAIKYKWNGRLQLTRKQRRIIKKNTPYQELKEWLR